MRLKTLLQEWLTMQVQIQQDLIKMAQFTAENEMILKYIQEYSKTFKKKDKSWKKGWLRRIGYHRQKKNHWENTTKDKIAANSKRRCHNAANKKLRWSHYLHQYRKNEEERQLISKRRKKYKNVKHKTTAYAKRKGRQWMHIIWRGNWKRGGQRSRNET